MCPAATSGITTLLSGSVHCFLLSLFLIPLAGVSSEKISWTESLTVLNEKLFSFLDSVTGLETLQKAYDDAAATSKITFKPLDGTSLINEVADSLGKLFGKKVEALQAAVTHAEKLIQDYDFDEEVQEVYYFHAHLLNDTVEPFEFNPQYQLVVNLENSSVHIPIDIYKGSKDIKKTIAWTDGLNDVWKENKEKDPSLLWQFFGSYTGVLRTYPASKFRNKTAVDLYDLRRRPWYTQGVSSPKDMLILLDKSGSAHGQALQLMRHSVSSILETLGENDFVNVAQFSDKAEFGACFHTFIQAIDRNKKKLVSYLKNIHARQVANYSKGFEFAFEAFLNFSNVTNNSHIEGANCNQLIILLTDGGAEFPTEIFKKYNSDKKIRIFTFAVGPTAETETATAKKIACRNRGNFYPITSMGAIRSTVQEYLSVLSGPMVRFTGHTWTSVHSDKSANMDQGLVISVTMPVFDRTKDFSNQTVLGVMGVDVSLKELSKVVPAEKFVPAGYAFAINSNGVILFHPELNSDLLTDDEDRSTNPVIDFAEIEADTPEREMIRTEMIDLKSNSVEITDYVTGFDDHHADKKKRTYYYTPIPGTNFSVAVVLPDYLKHYIETVEHMSLEQGQNLLLTNRSKIMSNYLDYCQDVDQIPVSNSSYGGDDMEEFLDRFLSNFTECEKEYVQNLLFDAEITSVMEDYWMSWDTDEDSNETDDSGEPKQEPENSDDGIHEREATRSTEEIISRFVATNNDFMRIYSKSSKFFTETVKPTNEPFYKRSFNNDLWMFSVYPEDVNRSNTAEFIMATKAVALKSNNYKAAVVGVHLALEKFHDLLLGNLSQCKPDITSCYVLDDGGFVLSSKDDNFHQVGKHFYNVDAEVMDALVSNSVFESHERVNYQGICIVGEETSAGFRLMPPFIYEILSFNWWTAASTWSYLSVMNLYSWLFTQIPNSGADSNDDEDGDDKEKIPCIRTLLQFNFNVTDISGTVECNNCTRPFRTFNLQGSNLLVVAIDGASCGCDDIQVPSLSTESYDSVDDESDLPTTCTAKTRYRKRQPCFDNNPYEPDSHCCASSLIMTSHLCLLLLLSVALRNLVQFLWYEGC